MKRPRFFTMLFVLLMSAPLFYSCLDEDDKVPYYAMATVKVIEGKDYYFALDNGKKMYPSDTTRIHDYKVTDGQRAIAWFDKLAEVKTGYDYNITLRGISDVLTKNIIPLTEETADSIGDNRISIYNREAWVAQGYLTIRFYFMGTYNPSQPHMLNLVQNETVEYEDDGYIHLEFRHNAYDDPRDRLMHGYVSFKLDKIAEEMKTAKGLKIRVKTIEQGEKFYILNLKDIGSTNTTLQGAAHTTGTIY